MHDIGYPIKIINGVPVITSPGQVLLQRPATVIIELQPRRPPGLPRLPRQASSGLPHHLGHEEGPP
jgi:hypothetical protein